MKFKNKWIIIILVFFPQVIFSQNLTSSPYSIFGIGEINTRGSSRNVAMGGTGIAMKSDVGLNNINPASYSSIDSMFFIYEIGILAEYSEYSTENNNQNQFIGNLSSIALGFQAKPWWDVSVGLTPFSSIGYDITTISNLQNDNSIYEDTYVGSGGITQIFMGNSFKISKNISVGLNLSYLFGSLEEDEEISTDGENIDYSINNVNHVSGLYLDYGLQVDIPMKKYKWTIGAIYGHKRYLSSSTDRMIYDGDGYILYTGEDLESDDDYIIPRKIGLGFSVVKNEKFTAAFDYTLNQWSEIEFTNSDLETKDSHKFSLGFEYTPEGRQSKKALKSLYYRIGGFYNSSYMNINNSSINSMALTFGLGIPVKRNLSMLNIAFEVGKNGTINNGLIQENFYTLNLNFSLQDLWFMKRKYN